MENVFPSDHPLMGQGDLMQDVIIVEKFLNWLKVTVMRPPKPRGTWLCVPWMYNPADHAQGTHLMDR